MNWEVEFYICPKCFRIAQARKKHHQRQMLHCAGFPAGDTQLKPPQDEQGNLKSRAPRWFVEQRWPHAIHHKEA